MLSAEHATSEKGKPFNTCSVRPVANRILLMECVCNELQWFSHNHELLAPHPQQLPAYPAHAFQPSRLSLTPIYPHPSDATQRTSLHGSTAV